MASPQALAAAHLAGDQTARLWLGEPWTGIRSCAEYTRSFLSRGRWDRPALAAIAHASGAAKSVVDAVADVRTAVVVTGQQPAVGGGPLYTLVKVAHAIALAKRLNDEGVPAVAWFWCASEDHDLGEAGHADLILRDGAIARISADLGGGRAALRHRPASSWWPTLIAQCQERLGPGLGQRWLLEQAPQDNEGMGAWLVRLMNGVFTNTPLVCVESHRVRPLWRSVWPRVVGDWPVQALTQRRSDLLRHGYADTFGELTHAPVFHDQADARTAIEPKTLTTLATADPDTLSPGAALRPILQQIALPSACAILGLAELAYHAAITPAYSALGAVQPLLIPRCSLTLVPRWIERAAQRHGLSAEALADGGSIDIEAPTLANHGRLTALADAIDQLTLGAAPDDRRICAAQVRLRRELDRLRASLVRGERASTGLPAPGALANYLYPRHRRHERVMSLCQAIWQHGPGIGANLVHAAGDTSPGGHRLVRLSS
ncbi:MAG: bacillithiol biosynthesis BshC [Planctomycetota bacterium]